MSYYYITQNGEVIDSSARIEMEGHTQISELEYSITRLAVRGYYHHEARLAVEKVYALLEKTIPCQKCGNRTFIPKGKTKKCVACGEIRDYPAI